MAPGRACVEVDAQIVVEVGMSRSKGQKAGKVGGMGKAIKFGVVTPEAVKPESENPEGSVVLSNRVVSFETVLKCQLTEDELRVKGAALADAIEEGLRAEEEFAGVKQQYKARIDGAAAKASMLSSVIRSKSEMRLTKCERVYDFELGLYLERRTDTGEVLPGSRRDLTEAERQQELGL
jgi:hypothetical protein